MQYLAEDLRAIWTRHRAWILALGVPLVLALALLTTAWFRCGFGGCPSLDAVEAVERPTRVTLVDREGQPLTELHPDGPARIALEQLPPYVPAAFLAVEDKRFRDHDGIDWVRVGGALWTNVAEGGIEEGSSTISMQLARNLFPDRIPRTTRTLGRKLREMRVAQQIESRFTKDEILELYLNHIPFGGGAQGIEAASKQYFGHGADRLSLSQAALLAALPKAPSRYDPRSHPHRARERRNLVLHLMGDQGIVPPDRAARARRASLGLGTADPETEPLAPYFVDRVEQELDDTFHGTLDGFDSIRVITSLDRTLQTAVRDELRAQLERIERGRRFDGPLYRPEDEMPEGDTDYLQGAMVVLRAHTGEVLAWVGGRDHDQSTFDRVAGVQRPVGSAFKPFVLATALDQGHFLSEHVSDRPLDIRLDDGKVWSPKNFENRYHHEVTLRNSIVHSKNVATVRVLQEAGLDNVRHVARKLGLPRDLPNVPALALGAADLSPLELATAYVPFATGGEAARPHTILRIENAETGEVLWDASPRTRMVLDPRVAYLVTDVLSDVIDRGTAQAVRAVGYRGPGAGKTGTTNRRQDAWFVGYTPELVSSLWIGFDRPRRIVAGATGGGLAAPVWGRVMREIYGERTDRRTWQEPMGIVSARVDTRSGFPLAANCRFAQNGSYEELFVESAMPRAICPRPPRPRWSSTPRPDRDLTGLLGERDPATPKSLPDDPALNSGGR